MLDTIIPGRKSRYGGLILVGLVIYALIIYAYAVLRFGGTWNENDTTQLTRAIYYADQEGTIIDSELTYGNGLTFQAVSLFVMHITGIPLHVLQVYVYPAIASLIPLVAYVTYRTLTRSHTVALLATLFLYLQPDFIFVTWRGSHEKLTWVLALLMLFFLGKTFVAENNWVNLRNILLLYVSAFAFICSNGFFASSLISAIALSFIAGWGILGIRNLIHKTGDVEIRRRLMHLFYATLVCGIMLYLFFFHIYPPALSLLNALRSLIDGLSALFLSADPVEESNPYNYVAETWVDLRLFALLTAISLVIIVGSFLVWLSGVPRFIRPKKLEITHLPRLFLWLIYPVFGFQLILSFIADRTGVVGSNLQVRLSTPTMLTAIPLVAIGIHGFFLHIQKPVLKHVLIGTATVFIPCFVVLTLFKATNEPLISFNWTFSTLNEQIAGRWLGEHRENAALWTGFDSRIKNAMLFYDPEILDEMRLVIGNVPPPGTQFYLTSVLEEVRWSRTPVTWPFLAEEDLIYDNGLVQLYFRIPRTIFQR